MRYFLIEKLLSASYISNMSDRPASLLKDVYTARGKAKQGAEAEQTTIQEGKKPWGSFESPMTDYDAQFEGVLHGTLGSFLNNLKQEKEKVFALDAMGQGGFFTVAPIDGEAFLTLADPRPESSRAQDEEINHREGIIGDILQGKTWRILQGYMERHAQEMNGGFDFIALRPVAGWNEIVGGRHEHVQDRSKFVYDLEWLILNKLFSVLSPQGGVLVSQKSQIQLMSEYSGWIEKLNRIEGIKAEEKDLSIKIVRLSDKVKQLPRISGSQTYDPEMLRWIEEMLGVQPS